MKSRVLSCKFVSSLSLALLFAGVAQAEPVAHTITETNIDWTSAGVAGTGGSGAGTITLSGIVGTPSTVFLYWHGIGNPAYTSATVTIDGNSVTGVNIGDSTTNCWGAGSSTAYRADVTAFVPGNGSYSIAGLSAGGSSNGASLVAIFDDGDSSNNRDLAFFEGNDSDTTGFPGEDLGWHAVLTPINYGGGTVAAQVHLADGQNAGDGPMAFTTVNGAVNIADSSTLYDGISTPSSGTGRNGHGLWDLHTFDITTAFGGVPGPVTLNIDGQDTGGDCLGLVLLLLDLEPFSAPEPPGVDLTPEIALNPVGTQHDLTATVTDEDGAVVGQDVSFEVTSGPNAGDAGADTTDVNGEATFSYSGDGGKGADEIVASIEVDMETISDSAFKFWDDDCQPNDVPDTCDIDCAGFGDACNLYASCGMSEDVDQNGQPDECNLPPDCSAAGVDTTDLWPPNHKYEDVSISGITDPDGDAVTTTVTGISQDEAINDDGDGNTCPDGKLPGGNVASLRRERSGLGDGRVYHVHFEGDDGRGGTCTGSVAVCVPHDQSGSGCVDQGPLVDSLVCPEG